MTGAKHWSPVCEIRNCCVLDEQLLDCSRCEQFPCDLTDAFKGRGGKYVDAVVQLMHPAKRAWPTKMSLLASPRSSS